MSSNFFNNIKIDSWYKAFIYLGSLLCIGSTFFEVHVFDNQNLFLLGLGLFCIGCGKWFYQRGAILTEEYQKRNFFKKIWEDYNKFAVALIIIGTFLEYWSIKELIKTYFL